MRRLSGFQGGQTRRSTTGMMLECYRGGLKSPHRSGGSERADDLKSRIDRILRGMGPYYGTLAVPESVVILPVVDLNMPVTLALVWRRNNTFLCLQILLLTYGACRTM